MTRNPRTFGLALIAVFAMSTIAASATQAAPEFTLEKYPGYIHATREQSIGSGEEFYEIGETKIECEVTHFESGTISEDASELTITPNVTD